MRFLHLVFLVAVAAEVPIPASLGQRAIQMELDRGLALAHVAATEQSVFCLQAEKIYAQIRTLLPKIGGMDARERAELQAKVRDLRMALDLIPGAGHAGRRLSAGNPNTGEDAGAQS